jgi:hypothetical protein
MSAAKLIRTWRIEMLPGDELLPQGRSTTYAITIAALPRH